MPRPGGCSTPRHQEGGSHPGPPGCHGIGAGAWVGNADSTNRGGGRGVWDRGRRQCRLGASRQEHTAQMCLPLRPGTQGPCCPIPSAQSQAGDRGAGARSKTQTSCCCQRCRDQLGMSRRVHVSAPQPPPLRAAGNRKGRGPCCGGCWKRVGTTGLLLHLRPMPERGWGAVSRHHLQQ